MTDPRPTLVASDLEGVLVPEIWVAFAEETGIEQLRLTTREISDYDELMAMRLEILDQHNLKLADIQRVIAAIDPLPGAADFVAWVRRNTQFIIISDTFYEFAAPLMAKLDFPTLFCHSLEVDANDRVTGYRLRLPHPKRSALRAFRGLGFHTLAMGDSYNDIAMLDTADTGLLFNPPPNVVADHPHLPLVRTYAEAREFIAGRLRLRTLSS